MDVVEDQDEVFVELLVEGLSKGVSECGSGRPRPRTALSCNSRCSASLSPWRERFAGELSAPSARYQDQPRPIATEAANVDLPNPAPATINVRRRCSASSSRRSSAGRPTCDAGSRGGTSLTRGVFTSSPWIGSTRERTEGSELP